MSFLTVTRRPDFSVFLCPEAQSAQFFAIQTHLSYRFYLAVDFLGLRRNGSLSWIINQAQDLLEQVSRHGNFSKAEVGNHVCDVRLAPESGSREMPVALPFCTKPGRECRDFTKLGWLFFDKRLGSAF